MPYQDTASAKESISNIMDWAVGNDLAFTQNLGAGWGAVFETGKNESHRYLLWQNIDDFPFAGIGMLNPTGNERRDKDSSMGSCMAFAYHVERSVLFWNLFSTVTLHISELQIISEPVGRFNDEAIELALSICDPTIAAWGDTGSLDGRSRQIQARCPGLQAPLMVFHLNKSGEPAHPTHVSNLEPMPWRY